MSELLDSRCHVCHKTDFQCGNCAKKDKQKKKEARLSAAAAKSGSKFAYVGKTLQAAIESAKKQNAPILKTAIESAKKVSADAAPEISGKFSDRCAAVGHMITAILDETTSAKALAAAAAPPPALAAPEISVPNVNLRNVLKAAPFRFVMTRIPRSGHCLFESFVLAFKLLKLPNMPKTQQQLRSACAKQLMEWNGQIPTLPPLFDSDDDTPVIAIRGGAEQRVSLKEYCNLLNTNLYGGLEEYMLIVQMYQLQVHLYQDAFYRGGSPVSIPIFRNSELPANHPDNAGPRIFMLLEMGKNGTSDHTTLMIHRYAQYDDLMSRMPVQHRDYKIVQGIHGRGMQSMRRFPKDDLIGKLISIMF